MYIVMESGQHVHNANSQSEAVAWAENRVKQWIEVGCNPRPIAVYYNGFKAIKVWEVGK